MEQLSSIYEKWLQLPRWQKWIVIILLGLLVFSAYYYLRVMPLKEELQSKQQEVERLSLTVSRLKAIEKRKKEIEKEIEELTQKIAQIESRLPTGKEEVSQIIKSITSATDSQMVIALIKKEKEENNRYYLAYPYRVKLIGTYPNFIRVCEKLSKADRIINFGDMEITALSEKEKKDYPNATVAVEMRIKAFTLKR